MKYWAYINNEILGPFEKEKLLELPNFNASSLICPQTPVGEKTEDWKEASTYFGMSATPNASAPTPLTPQSTDSTTKQPDADPPTASEPEKTAEAGQASDGITAPEAGRFTEPESHNSPEAVTFKPMTASALGPAAAPPSSTENQEMGVDHFRALKNNEKTGSTEMDTVKNASASFDPLTLSQIGKRAGIIVPKDQGASTVEIKAAYPAGGETFQSEKQVLNENALVRQELNSQLEPLRKKLEQMDAMLSTMANSQFQRDLLGRMGSLENAISDIKISLSCVTQRPDASFAPEGSFAPAQENPKQGAAMEKRSDAVYSIPPAITIEKLQAEQPQKEVKKPEIIDSGRKKLRIASFFGNIFKFITTLLLITAIALVAVFVLKQQGIFDATKFIPFPIPFLTSDKTAATMAVQNVQTSQFPTGQDQAAQDAKEQIQGVTAQKQVPPATTETVPPETIYFIRNYALRPGGFTLENAIRKEAAKAGWDSEKLYWEGKPAATEGSYRIAAVVPSKDGKSRLAFTYEANAKQKIVKPLDDAGATGMETLIAASALKKQSKTRAAKNRQPAQSIRKQAANLMPSENTAEQAPIRTQPRKAPQKQSATADEYEYVDDEDTGK